MVLIHPDDYRLPESLVIWACVICRRALLSYSGYFNALFIHH